MDYPSFATLTDRKLIDMGITAVGPRVKIMREVNRIVQDQQQQDRDTVR